MQRVMKTSQQQTSQSGADEWTCSLAAFRASLSVMPGDEEARKMTAISGQQCTAPSMKSSPLGLWLKTLLESSRWSSRARFLKWQVKPLFSERATHFTDTNCEKPLHLNESAQILKVTDMPSNRCLFLLVPSEPHTDEIGCSSSQGELLPTPTTVQTDEPPEKMRARAEKNGYKNGTKFGSLTSQIKYDERVKELLLPTSLAVEREHPERVENLKAAGATRINSRVNGDQRPNGLIDFMQFYDLLPTPVSQGLKVCDENGKTQFIDLDLLPTPVVVDNPHPNSKVNENGRRYNNKEESSHSMGLADRAQHGLLHTPTAIEGVKWTNTWNPNSQMGQSLSAMVGSGMLPTPVTQDFKKRGPNSQQQGIGDLVYELANGSRDSEEVRKSGAVGQTSRLSPLFTEEMMGFPLMWTALPFLSASGEQKH